MHNNNNKPNYNAYKKWETVQILPVADVEVVFLATSGMVSIKPARLIYISSCNLVTNVF